MDVTVISEFFILMHFQYRNFFFFFFTWITLEVSPVTCSGNAKSLWPWNKGYPFTHKIIISPVTERSQLTCQLERQCLWSKVPKVWSYFHKIVPRNPFKVAIIYKKHFCFSLFWYTCFQTPAPVLNEERIGIGFWSKGKGYLHAGQTMHTEKVINLMARV